MISYSFYSGAENRFILIDNRSRKLPDAKSKWVTRLCNSVQPIADGVILAESSSLADAKMRIFNRDGSEAEMCGNGLRVFIRFLEEIGIQKKNYKIETLASSEMGILSGSILGEEVEVVMGSPHSYRWDLSLTFDEKSYTGHFLNTGVPQFVISLPSISRVPVETLGRKIRFHETFGIQGTNVTFMSISSDKSVNVRVYERGVEGETLACGTGAVAACVVGALRHGLSSPVQANFRTKESLLISFSHEEKSVSSVSVRGPAKKIGQGYFVF